MVILGINSVFHEASASLILDGRVVAAAEEERFNRRKHGKSANVDNPDELPLHSIDFCLAAAGLKRGDITDIAYSFDPALRETLFRLDPQAPVDSWGGEIGEKRFRSHLHRVPEALRNALQLESMPQFHWVRHHLAHAASAFYPSGFGDAAIMVIDGIGEGCTALLGAGNTDGVTSLYEQPFPESIGFLWEKICKYLGFSEYDSCKLMGLAAYGDASRFARQFSQLALIERQAIRFDSNLLSFRSDDYSGIESLLGEKRTQGEIQSRHADIAATLQDFTDRSVLMLSARLADMVTSRRLCYAGGVALNCATNWRLKEEGPFTEIFIPSAPHDAGTAVGAALVVAHDFQKTATEKWSPYVGPEYSNESISAALDAGGWSAEFSSNPGEAAASLISEGKVIGWFQGRMEFGPRALGNRSLLADPRRPESRQRINAIVKRREMFRPFAPAVLEEEAAQWFRVGRDSTSLRYMLFACPVRPDKASLIPAVIHQDGTARLQIVRRTENPAFHALLSAFNQITGVPIVLNTSFNDNEPIVNSPEDALRTFRNAPIDALVIGNYIVASRRG